MHIEIEMPRPGLTLLAITAVTGWAIALSGGHGAATQATVVQTAQSSSIVDARPPIVITHADQTQEVLADSAAIGGDDTPAPVRRAIAEAKVRDVRSEQAALAAKEDIMRYQLNELQKERQALGPDIDSKLEDDFRASNKLLVSLIEDEKRAEQFLLTAMNEMWEAEDRGVAIGQGLIGNDSGLALAWPVEPLLGISAYFHDKSYEAIFKMKHNAVDIPTNQGTIVMAAAGGVVKDVVDHGLGFNYITIEHPGGYSTLYGHLTKFSVQKGDHVMAGDPIGFSGGRPGSPGAGLSTGPHLHFAVYMNGAPTDPLPFLPRESTVKVPVTDAQ